VNWKSLVNDLRGAGYSQARIAEEMGKAQSWVADIWRGRYADLKWNDGQKLIELHRQVVVLGAVACLGAVSTNDASDQQLQGSLLP
jgi:predicted transcriptional regulator